MKNILRWAFLFALFNSLVTHGVLAQKNSSEVVDERATKSHVLSNLTDDEISFPLPERTIRRFWSPSTYKCDKSDPHETLRVALEKVSREEISFRGKDSSGLYRKNGQIFYGRSPEEEMDGLSKESFTGGVDNDGTTESRAWVESAELIVNENWIKRQACLIWFNQYNILHVSEISLNPELINQVRFELGVSQSGDHNNVNLPTRKYFSGSAIDLFSRGFFPSDLNLGEIQRIVLRVGGLSSQLPIALLAYKGNYVGATFAVLRVFDFNALYEAVTPRTAYVSQNAAKEDELVRMQKPILDQLEDSVRPRHFHQPLIVGVSKPSWDRKYKWSDILSAEETASSISALFPSSRTPGSNTFIGMAAKRDVIINQLKHADFVSFSTHAVADAINPSSQTHLVLGDGYLGADDFKRQDTYSSIFSFESNPIIILNSCELALGKPFEGGVYGLTRTLLRRGANGVVSNLWDVDAARNGQLAIEIAKRVALGQGLEFAVRDMIRMSISEHPDDPSVWSAFVVSGTPSYYCKVCR